MESKGNTYVSDQLIQLTRLDAGGAFTKEDIFNWIVDLSQLEFDELCNQIIALYKFQQTYEGAVVSDEEALLQPWLAVLPRVEFKVEHTGTNYQKKFFYRFLTNVNEDVLEGICEELLSLWSHARENDKTYIISQIYPAVKEKVEYWRISFNRTKHYTYLPGEIINWQEMLLFR